jgi:hypothetical protein
VGFLAVVELGLLAAEMSFGLSDLHALSRPQPDEIGFELSHHGKDIEEQPSDRIVGVVDGPAQVEAHLSDRQLVGNCPRIGKGTGQSIELRDDKGVALTTRGQGLTQTRPFTIGASQSVINVDPARSYSKSGESVALGSEVLLISGYPGVSDE